MAEKKSMELKKHVAAIHAGTRMTLLQRKLANALLYNAYDQLLEKEEHHIHIQTLCQIIGYDSKDYKTIRRSLVDLISTVIQWNLVDGDKLDSEGIWNASSIIASASIDGPICTYTYSPTMRKLLYHPELYGRLSMVVLSRFKSTYGIALYENCMRFQNIDQTPWLELSRFRKLMGVEESKYPIFRDLKNRVIEKAVAEVNQYSPIKVVPHYKKEGRNVTAVQFKIEKPRAAKQVVMLLDDVPLTEMLKNRFGLSKKQTEAVMTTYDQAYILEKIKVIETSASFASGKIVNLAKYLLSALQDDYQHTKKSQAVVAPDRFELANQKRVAQHHAEHLRKEQNKTILKLFEQLGKKEQKNILNLFSKHISRSVYGNIYLRDGLSNILIADQFCHFARQQQLAFIQSATQADSSLEEEVV